MELIYRWLSIWCLVYSGITLLLLSMWTTQHCSFPLEEHDSNPNEREHVKVMGYFNLSREARGSTGLGCLTKFLHQVNTTYSQRNSGSWSYVTLTACNLYVQRREIWGTEAQIQKQWEDYFNSGVTELTDRKLETCSSSNIPRGKSVIYLLIFIFLFTRNVTGFHTDYQYAWSILVRRDRGILIPCSFMNLGMFSGFWPNLGVCLHYAQHSPIPVYSLKEDI